MKFNVTKIKFDFDEADELDWDSQLTYSEEQIQITHDNLGVWEADNEDDHEAVLSPTLQKED